MFEHVSTSRRLDLSMRYVRSSISSGVSVRSRKEEPQVLIRGVRGFPSLLFHI